MLERGTIAAVTAALAFGGAAIVLASCGTTLTIEPDQVADAGPDGSRSGGDGAGADVLVSCDANVATDPASCGACGHSCGRAACRGGLCAPESVKLQAGEVALGPNARVEIRGALAAMTDDAPSIAEGGPGFIHTFDPTADAPKPALFGAGYFNHASLVGVLASGDVAFTTGSPSSQLFSGDASVDLPTDSFLSLTVNPAGERMAVTTSRGEARSYSPALGLLNAVTVPGASDVAFDGDDFFLVAAAAGILRCPAVDPAEDGGTDGTCPVVVKPPVRALALAVVGSTLYFSTVDGELRSAALPAAAPSTGLLAKLVKPRQVRADSGGVYVLDNDGIHTTMHGAPLLVASSADAAIFSFALSKEWVYYLAKEGLFRVHR